MAIKQEAQQFDPFARAIPGQSFTDEPGLRPYERPPLETDPEKLYKVLDEQLTEESTAEKLSDILDIGVSVETLCEVVAQKCFTEGVCSPDVAEIIKPFIFMTIAEIGSEYSVRDMVMFNENEEEGRMSDEQKLLLMRKLDSERFNDTLERSETMDFNEQELTNLEDEQLSPDIDEYEMETYADPEEEEGMAGAGSFLDMDMDTSAEEEVV